MSRNPIQGVKAIDDDVKYLMKIKTRILLDPKRSELEKEKLTHLCVELITHLLNGKRHYQGSVSK